jgi:hypothetical protein
MAWPKIPSLLLTDAVDIYAGSKGRDSGGGIDPVYPAQPTMPGVLCSVQWESVDEVVDDQNRVVRMNLYNVMFQNNPSVKARDKMIWQDSGGVTHTLFVRSSVELTGEGQTWEVPVVERISP